MGRQKRDSDEIVDAAGNATRRGGQSFKERQGGQAGGVRDRNRAVQDKDDELAGDLDGTAGASRPGGGDRPSGADGAGNVSNSDRLFADLAGQEIAAGHAFDKHVVQRGEFPGLRTRREFAELVTDVITHGRRRTLDRGRTAYWREWTIVIRDPFNPDGGTAFRPIDGIDYFLSDTL